MNGSNVINGIRKCNKRKNPEQQLCCSGFNISVFASTIKIIKVMLCNKVEFEQTLKY